MTQMYDYGFFIHDNHLNNFTHLLTNLYDDSLDGSVWSSIPGNEIAYLYAATALMNEPIRENLTYFEDIIDYIDFESKYFRSEERYVYMLAKNSLQDQIIIDFQNEIPEDYTFVVKTMIDLLTNDFDLVMDKKFELISFVRYQMEIARAAVTRNDYDFELER